MQLHGLCRLSFRYVIITGSHLPQAFGEESFRRQRTGEGFRLSP